MSKKKIRILYFSFEIISWVCLFTPLLVVIIMNWDKYFVQKSGWSVAMGGVYAILLIVLLLKFGSKKFNKIFWITSLLIVVYCLNSIIQDMLLLTFVSWIGGVAYWILEFPKNYFKKRYDTYIDEVRREQARQEVRTQYREETEEIEGR